MKHVDVFEQEIFLKLKFSAVENGDGTVHFDAHIPGAYCGGGSSTASGALRGAFESLVRKFNEKPESVLELLSHMQSDTEDLKR